MKLARHTRRTALTILTWLFATLAVVPILWMALTSFHSEADAATNPPSLLAPLTLESWGRFFGSATGTNPLPYLLNSLIASGVSTLLVLALSLPAAYALSVRSVPKWSDYLSFLLGTKMLPIVAGLLPVYLIAKTLGVLDTSLLLIVLYTAANIPIAIWMLRSFLIEIPTEIFEAAAVDGAGSRYVFLRIVIPLASPGLAATALICFIFSWNELLLANALTSVRAATAPVFLTSFVTSQGLFLAQLCAASLAVSLPVIIAGFAAQDKLVQGLSLGAIK